MSSQYTDLYQQTHKMHQEILNTVLNNGSQQAIELRDVSRKLLRDAEAGIELGQLVERSYDLEQRFANVSRNTGSSSPPQSRPRPPLDRGGDVRPGNTRNFYGLGTSSYRKDWK